MRSMVLMTMFAIGGLAGGATLAYAGGCGGGGGYRSGARGYGGGGGSCCAGMSMGSMPMAGSNMAGMSMAAPAAPAPAADMSGMNMGDTAPAPAGNTVAAAARYTCPMHPNVVASFAAKCPYCGMALAKK